MASPRPGQSSVVFSFLPLREHCCLLSLKFDSKWDSFHAGESHMPPLNAREEQGIWTPRLDLEFGVSTFNLPDAVHFRTTDVSYDDTITHSISFLGSEGAM